MITNVTTTEQMDHTNHPILYHLGRDPGERYPIPSWTEEYKNQIRILMDIWREHLKTLVLGKPRLNWCDKAVMVIGSWVQSAFTKLLN